ncbi:putative uridine kinase C227.14 isoform X1 [Rhododendron vialii]|uniref:putative uridine kinase C227.14 isoform X1 n=1 Tax=Rhododendron vialii TaxID=182163 RepID=UPI00265FD50E|nr:putative uridine kinase C227.14 isoform X1 [Rhododendron vialii]
MEVSLFSTTSTGLFGSSSAEISFPQRKRLLTWNRVSVSISPSKGAERLGRTEFHLLKRHSLQVACSQKKEVHVVEASCMDDIYNALAERLVPTAAVASNPNFKHIVGLAGPPGAGKSTIANEIVRRVNKLWPEKSCSFDSQVDPPEVAAVLPMDGFHLYRHQLDAMEDPEEAHARRGAPWTFDPELLLKCLNTLRVQGSVYAPSFDHGVGDPVKDDIFVNLHTLKWLNYDFIHLSCIIFYPGCRHKVVIVEGNYLLLDKGVWKDISSVFDEKWFIEVDIETTMQRVLKRHILTGKPPDVAKWRIEHNDQPNAELIMKSKKNADLIIKSVDL